MGIILVKKVFKDFRLLFLLGFPCSITKLMLIEDRTTLFLRAPLHTQHPMGWDFLKEPGRGGSPCTSLMGGSGESRWEQAGQESSRAQTWPQLKPRFSLPRELWEENCTAVPLTFGPGLSVIV